MDSRIEKREPIIPEERPTAKVVNLMDALRASLKEPAASAAANDSKPAAAVTEDKPKGTKADKAKAPARRKAG